MRRVCVCIILGLLVGVAVPALAAETFVLAPRLAIFTCSDGVRQQDKLTPVEAAEFELEQRLILDRDAMTLTYPEFVMSEGAETTSTTGLDPETGETIEGPSTSFEFESSASLTLPMLYIENAEQGKAEFVASATIADLLGPSPSSEAIDLFGGIDTLSLLGRVTLGPDGVPERLKLDETFSPSVSVPST